MDCFLSCCDEMPSSFSEEEPPPSTAESDDQIEGYTYHEKIGQGNFGAVYRVTDRNGNEFACKQVDTSCFTRNVQRMFKDEILILKKCSAQCTRIATLYDVINKNRKWHLIMELCRGGELLGNSKNITSERHVKIILKQVFEALQFVHDKRISHMDMKQENIIFLHSDPDDLTIRLIDFGLSTRRKEGRKNMRRCGSLDYMAPEVIMGKGSTEQADMWAMGVLTYELLCGSFPFRVTKSGLRKTTNMKKFFSQQNIDFSLINTNHAKNVVKSLLSFDAQARPTASEVLLYPWFTSGEQSAFNPEVMRALQRNTRMNKLQRAMSPLMVKRMEDHHLVEYVHKLHQNTDKDLSGEIDLGEFKQCLQEMGETNMTDEEIKEIFESIDLDDSGEISLAEFMEWFASDYTFKQDDRLWNFVRSLDKDSDGFITLSEIEIALKEAQPSMWRKYLAIFRKLMPSGKLCQRAFSDMLSESNSTLEYAYELPSHDYSESEALTDYDTEEA